MTSHPTTIRNSKSSSTSQAKLSTSLSSYSSLADVRELERWGIKTKDNSALFPSSFRINQAFESTTHSSTTQLLTMLFSRYISAFFLLAASSPLVSATPTPVDSLEIRQNDAALSVITTLKTATDSILPQIDAFVLDGTATDANVAPLILELTTAFTTANTGILAIPAAERRNLATRQSDDEIANLLAGIIGSLVTTLEGVATLPLVATLLPGLDLALSNLLGSLGVLLANVLKLVAGLLENVAALLRRLAFGLTLGFLGL